MERIDRICKEKSCKKPFSISVEEQEWLKERNLELFQRCKSCRTKRREVRLAETRGEFDVK